MNLKYFFTFLKKYKIIIAIIFLLLLFFNIFNNLKEAYTSCSQFKNCKDCVGGKVIDTSSPCYWNNSKQQCGSFKDRGYSNRCNSSPTPTPTPTPTPNPKPTPEPCPVCPTCPKLTRLKNPTYITEQ